MKVSSSKSQLSFVRLAGDTFFADEALSFSWALSDKSLTVGRRAPIAAEIDEEHPLKTNGKIFYRKQLPLELSHASTVHKYQGLTAQHDVVIDPCRNPFAMGLEYVALSRTRSLQKLHLIAPVHEKHFASRKFSKCFQMIHDEYKRLSLLAPIVTDND
jgi:hypothetical protein